MSVLSWESTSFDGVFSDSSDFERDSFIVVPGFLALEQNITIGTLAFRLLSPISVKSVRHKIYFMTLRQGEAYLLRPTTNSYQLI